MTKYRIIYEINLLIKKQLCTNDYDDGVARIGMTWLFWCQRTPCDRTCGRREGRPSDLAAPSPPVCKAAESGQRMKGL